MGALFAELAHFNGRIAHLLAVHGAQEQYEPVTARHQHGEHGGSVGPPPTKTLHHAPPAAAATAALLPVGPRATVHAVAASSVAASLVASAPARPSKRAAASKPLSAAVLFAASHRPRIAAANPGLSFQAVSKLVADAWLTASDEEKRKFEEMEREGQRAAAAGAEETKRRKNANGTKQNAAAATVNVAVVAAGNTNATDSLNKMTHGRTHLAPNTIQTTAAAASASTAAISHTVPAHPHPFATSTNIRSTHLAGAAPTMSHGSSDSSAAAPPTDSDSSGTSRSSSDQPQSIHARPAPLQVPPTSDVSIHLLGVPSTSDSAPTPLRSLSHSSLPPSGPSHFALTPSRVAPPHPFSSPSSSPSFFSRQTPLVSPAFTQMPFHDRLALLSSPPAPNSSGDRDEIHSSARTTLWPDAHHQEQHLHDAHAIEAADASAHAERERGTSDEKSG